MDWTPQASSKLSRENKNIATKTYLLYHIAADGGKVWGLFRMLTVLKVILVLIGSFELEYVTRL